MQSCCPLALLYSRLACPASTPGLTTVVVLDNASIHHNIDQETIDRWFLEHRMVLFYLPPYSPELNRRKLCATAISHI